MLKDFKYIFKDWEDELLKIATDAIDCSIASAYLNAAGVSVLSRIAARLTELVNASGKTFIRVILSKDFAPTIEERAKILKNLSALPGVDARIYINKELQHRKNYIFKAEEEIRVLVGSVNFTASGLYKNLEMATLSIHENNDEKAKVIISEYESLWDNSKNINEYLEGEEMIDTEPLFELGDTVKRASTGEIGAIIKVIPCSRSYSYKVMINGKTTTVQEIDLETHVDQEESLIEKFHEGNFGSHNDYKIFHTWFRLKEPLENNLYSYLGSKTIFNAHQFKPLLRFLSPGSDERLFIADEVGVGKTIETGIIINEMLGRERLSFNTPVLIICPNTLGPKWQKEMKNRFGLDFELHDGKSFQHMIKDTINTGILPKKYTLSIAGLQLARMENNLKFLKELDGIRNSHIFNLIIVDEAHHMRNNETSSNELGSLLSGMTEMMLMLSATPLNLKNEDFFNQMHILNPSLFPDLTTFQTLQYPVIQLNKLRRLIAKNDKGSRKEIFDVIQELRRDASGQIICEHTPVKNFINQLRQNENFSSEEIVKYEKLFVSLSPLYASFTRTRKREALDHQIYRDVHHLGIVLSPDEMDFMNKTLETIKKYYISIGYSPTILPFMLNMHMRMVSSCLPAMRDYFNWCINENKIFKTDSLPIEDIDDDSQMEQTDLDLNLKQEFAELLEETKTLENIDSKYDQFKIILTKILSNKETSQVMVFSFFVRTLKYLQKRLDQDGISVGIIYGDIPVEERYIIMEDFKKGKFQVLLSSEVGGEGLDFQFCKAMINYDLPYNPMRIEQRIGRIDRFGQKADKIIIGNLFIKDTIDEEIYVRLYQRIKLAEDGVGCLEPILGKEISDIQNAIISGNLSEKEKEHLSQRIEHAVNSAKLEMEEFEKNKAELLGDDFLAKPINQFSKNNEFITPNDAIDLTYQCLKQWEGCKCKINEDKTITMQLSSKLVSELENYVRKPKKEMAYDELSKLFESNKDFNVIFDGSLAENYPNSIFLSPTGYWSKFLTDSIKEKNILKTIFSFGVKDSAISLPIGKYLIFLFKVETQGVRKEIQFLGLPIDIATMTKVEVNYEKLPRILAQIDTFHIDLINSDIDLESILNISRDHINDFIDKKRISATEDIEFRVDSKIVALKKASEIKIKKIQQHINTHIENRGDDADKNFLRLQNAQIDKENSRLEMRIGELKKQRNLSPDFNIESIIYLKVEE